MTRANEDIARSHFPSPYREVPWLRSGWMANALSFSSLDRGCWSGPRIFPDLHAVVDGEMWVVEIETTHATSNKKLREWGFVLDA